MKFLFDANALLDLLKRGRDVIKNQYVLDLTIYEIGNAIWKEVNLFKTISGDDAKELMESIGIILQNMNVIRIRGDLKEILEIAIKENLTFYDASYLYYAKRMNLTLVTNDKKLFKAAKGKIYVVRSDEI